MYVKLYISFMFLFLFSSNYEIHKLVHSIIYLRCVIFFFFLGEKRSDKSLQKEGGQRNRTRNSYRRKGAGTNDWMGRERKRCILDVSD